jgi:CubicO group peptidase (beta-lactamase class C family)
VLLIAQNGEVLFCKAVGNKGTAEVAQPMTVDTAFDIAGLTQPMATMTAMMRLVDMDKVHLHDRVSVFIQGFGVHHKAAITISHLLTHSSGLAHWAPFFEELLRENAGARMGILTSRGARDYIINAINRSALKYPVGTRQLYSDIGFILLGHLIELLTGLPLDKAIHKLVLQPFGLKGTSFIDLSMIKRRGIHPVTDMIAPTEECAWRKRVLCGEVHDDNAWAMGGIAGHSGLFSRAHDVHLFAREIIMASRGASTVISRATFDKFWHFAGDGVSPIDGASWRHGLEMPSRENGMEGLGFSKEAAGINGFTGCSVWIDPESGLDVVLMSNRIHPNRSSRKIITFRPELHKAIISVVS